MIIIYAFIAFALVIFLGSKINFSKRYDRNEMSDWKKLDLGIDPSNDEEDK